MKDKIMKIVLVVVIIEVLLLTIGTLFAMLGLFDFQTGCVYRYDTSGNGTPSDGISRSVSIRGDGNYSSSITKINGINTVVSDPSQYGQWKRAGLSLKGGQVIGINVTGSVSLCKSYLPPYNIGSDGNLDQNKNPIAIPRVSDTTAPVTLIFDARTAGWKNLLQLYPGDIVEVIVNDQPSYGGNAAVSAASTNIFTGASISANCSKGSKTYAPICGIWSPWNGAQSYVNHCTYYYGPGPSCGTHCCDEWGGTCWDFFSSGGPCYNSCQNNKYTSATLPLAYPGNTSLNIPGGSTPTLVPACDATQTCSSDPTACNNACGSLASYSTSCAASCACTTPSCSACDITSCAAGDTGCQTQCGAQNTCTSCIATCGTQYNTCMASANTLNCSTAQTTCNNTCNAALSNNTCTNTTTCIANCKSASLSTCQGACTDAAATCTTGCGPSDLSVKACLAGNSSQVTSFNTAVAGYKYWFSARDVGGLLTRSSNSSATAKIDLSSGGAWTAIMDPALEYNQDQYTGRKIMNQQYGAGNTSSYLQYRFYSDPNDTTGASYADHTGGYVFQVKHTKCYRQNGAAIADSGYTVNGSTIPRGQILYVVSSVDPGTNQTISAAATALVTDANGNVTDGITVPDDASGDLWFKIDNNSNDYKDSEGTYILALSLSQTRGTFINDVLTPLINIIKTRVDTAGMDIFQNLICYNQQPNGSCTNFFNYIRAMLTLYIMTYGMMFMTGMVKASYQDVVIRVVKVGIVAGLISGDTFIWFQDHVFNFAIDFTDQIIANFGGFHNVSSVNSPGVVATNYTAGTNISGSGPFMFLDTIFTKIFLTQTTTVQLLAIMGIGLIGILYFIIVGVAIVIMILVGMRAIAVYIIAMVAIAFLISLAPIFLTFMLFEQTYYLFENWYKALFRYMMEPVILMIGVIVLLQIFTLYMDNVLSYSACWKCALAFYIPFVDLLPLPGLENLPLFCVNWFAPWGVDNTGNAGQLGMDLTTMLGLIIVAFAMYGYSDLAQQIAMQLTSAGYNSPSSISAGMAMAKGVGQAALRRVGMDDQTRGQVKREQGQNRMESRQALKQHKQEIIQKEKDLGIYKSDTTKSLEKNQARLSNAGTAMKEAPRNLSDRFGITKPDAAKALLKDPVAQQAIQAAQKARDEAHRANLLSTAQYIQSPEGQREIADQIKNPKKLSAAEQATATAALSFVQSQAGQAAIQADLKNQASDPSKKIKGVDAVINMPANAQNLSGTGQAMRPSVPNAQNSPLSISEAVQKMDNVHEGINKAKQDGVGPVKQPTKDELDALKGKTTTELSAMRKRDLDMHGENIGQKTREETEAREAMSQARQHIIDTKKAGYSHVNPETQKECDKAADAYAKAAKATMDARADFQNTQHKYQMALKPAAPISPSSDPAVPRTSDRIPNATSTPTPGGDAAASSKPTTAPRDLTRKGESDA